MAVDSSSPTGAQGYVDANGVDLEMMKDGLRMSPFAELGSTGLKRASGYVDEEFLPQLRGRKAVQVFKEMSENDPLVGALLFTIDRLLRNVKWNVIPAGKTAEDARAAEFVEQCRMDVMSTAHRRLGEFVGNNHLLSATAVTMRHSTHTAVGRPASGATGSSWW